MDIFEINLNLAYKNLIGKQVDIIVKKLVKRFVEHSQNLKDGHTLLSDDSGLKNVWEEICVDMQGEWTFYHQTYISQIEMFVENVLYPKLTELEKTMIWTQTDEFDEWIEELEEKHRNEVNYSIDFSDMFCYDALLKYISNAIMQEAMNYTNSRIDKYLYER